MKRSDRTVPLNWRCGVCGRRAEPGHACDLRDAKPEVDPLVVTRAA